MLSNREKMYDVIAKSETLSGLNAVLNSLNIDHLQKNVRTWSNARGFLLSPEITLEQLNNIYVKCVVRQKLLAMEELDEVEDILNTSIVEYKPSVVKTWADLIGFLNELDLEPFWALHKTLKWILPITSCEHIFLSTIRGCSTRFRDLGIQFSSRDLNSWDNAKRWLFQQAEDNLAHSWD